MRVEIAADAEAAAARAAAFIAQRARDAAAAQRRFAVAFSGGRSPAAMFRALAALAVNWREVDVFQVDERVAPAGHPDRNLTALQRELLDRVGARAHVMPVEDADLAAAAGAYAATLGEVCGDPPLLDVAQLGLGADGHTASLVPGDPVLQVEDRDVALAGPYQGRRRMTLTFPVLRRARCLVWLVTGAEKAPMLARLLAGDETIPAGRLRADNGVVFADAAALPSA